MRGQAMRGDRASRADKMKMDERARKGEGAVPAPAAK
jgi:hypothetical protein